MASLNSAYQPLLPEQPLWLEFLRPLRQLHPCGTLRALCGKHGCAHSSCPFSAPVLSGPETASGTHTTQNKTEAAGAGASLSFPCAPALAWAWAWDSGGLSALLLALAWAWVFPKGCEAWDTDSLHYRDRKSQRETQASAGPALSRLRSTFSVPGLTAVPELLMGAAWALLLLLLLALGAGGSSRDMSSG